MRDARQIQYWRVRKQCKRPGSNVKHQETVWNSMKQSQTQVLLVGKKPFLEDRQFQLVLRTSWYWKPPGTQYHLVLSTNWYCGNTEPVGNEHSHRKDLILLFLLPSSFSPPPPPPPPPSLSPPLSLSDLLHATVISLQYYFTYITLYLITFELSEIWTHDAWLWSSSTNQ